MNNDQLQALVNKLRDHARKEFDPRPLVAARAKAAADEAQKALLKEVLK